MQDVVEGDTMEWNELVNIMIYLSHTYEEVHRGLLHWKFATYLWTYLRILLEIEQ